MWYLWEGRCEAGSGEVDRVMSDEQKVIVLINSIAKEDAAEKSCTKDV